MAGAANSGAKSFDSTIYLSLFLSIFLLFASRVYRPAIPLLFSLTLWLPSRGCNATRIKGE